MNTNIEKFVKEADLRLQVQFIESNCKTICKITDGTIELGSAHIETIHDISQKMLNAVKNYYKIEQEINEMK